MSYGLKRETYNITNAVTKEVQSSNDSIVVGTDKEVFELGTILVNDTSSENWRKAVAIDIPDVSTSLSVATPMLGIVKNKFIMDGTERKTGILLAGEVHRKYINVTSFTGKEMDVEYCLMKTGIYMVGRN